MLNLNRRNLGAMSLSLSLTLSLSIHLPVQAQSVPTHAAEMLKWSMAKYAKFTTYRADCSWSDTFGSLPAAAGTSRAVWYQKPNLFKVVSTHAAGRMVQTSVSDGSRLLEYAIGVGAPGQRYSAPPSIADAASMQMRHPMFCGSLLYRFFGGADRYSELVDEAKQQVTFGASETIDGQACKTIKFWALGPTLW